MLGFFQLGGLSFWQRATKIAQARDLPVDTLGEIGERMFTFLADVSAAADDG